jgi:hypothetical protein
LITSDDRWQRLGEALYNNLIQRGTPAATEAIRKINQAFPNENLDRVERIAEEFARQKTWTPFPPSDLLALVLEGIRKQEGAVAPACAKRRGRPAQGEQEAASDTRQRPDLPPMQTSTQIRAPLHDVLKEAESRTADSKLRNKLVAVLRYGRYLDDLKVLNTACKRYQTLALLEQDFRDLDVWAAMDDRDKADIAKGDFQPGIFAWSLVKRMIGLRGRHNRTLKNYRRSLRAAGLL